MTFLEIIDALLLRPLQTLFELIYCNANDIIGNPGLSIIALSLFMNILVLPLYNKADALQEEERQMEARLQKGVAHIKKTFRGDERMMILQTYYRQNDYKPTYVLRSAVSLMLEIPFFMAAYRFLSGLQLLQGVPFGPIADLGKADGLLHLGGLSVNILPVIMTAVNLVSCVIFTKGAPKKTKIQLYGMAVFFLFFLYDSPSGLVFYWTLNNIFSLGKTIFYKLKNPWKIVKPIGGLIGAALAVGVLAFYHAPRPVVKTGAVLIGAALQLPWLLDRRRKKTTVVAKKEYHPNGGLFAACGLFLALFIGAYIPLSVIVASAQEFVNIQQYRNPLWFVASGFCIAFGLFVIWLGIFYRLADPKGKVRLETVLWIFSGVAVLDFMLFGRNLGMLSSTLVLNGGLSLEIREILINICAVAGIGALLYIVYRKLSGLALRLMTVVILAAAIMIPGNAVKVNQQVSSMKEVMESGAGTPSYTMSKDGKNVIVVMLDRGMGEFLPYLFQEKPELKEQFSGFTAYTNVVSTGAYTNFGIPALVGGYDYTVENINKRTEESLKDKQNEALRVMPVLFDENGYDVTVFDPTYANYKQYPEVKIYADHPNIKGYVTKGYYMSEDTLQTWMSSNMRNFFLYGLMKASPLAVQKYIYGDGRYNSGSTVEFGRSVDQVKVNSHVANGMDTLFMNTYNVLTQLPQITKYEQTGNTFLFMTNETTHEPILLQEPEYVPQNLVDNTQYDEEHMDRFTVNGVTLDMDSGWKYGHYQVNMAALIQLGNWFDQMRQNGVYDNTRIILVADHGRDLQVNPNRFLPDGFDTDFVFPLLMVKDFNAEGFSFSDDFMVTADVPALATENLIQDPKNPFTGNPISSAYKEENPVYVFYSDECDILINNGNQFLPGTWYRIDHQDMRNVDNWVCVERNAVFPE